MSFKIKSLPAFLTRPRENNILKLLADFNQLELIFCNNGCWIRDSYLEGKYSVVIWLESLSSLTLTRTYEWLIDGLTRLILTLI